MCDCCKSVPTNKRQWVTPFWQKRSNFKNEPFWTRILVFWSHKSVTQDSYWFVVKRCIFIKSYSFIKMCKNRIRLWRYIWKSGKHVGRSPRFLCGNCTRYGPVDSLLVTHPCTTESWSKFHFNNESSKDKGTLQALCVWSMDLPMARHISLHAPSDPAARLSPSCDNCSLVRWRSHLLFWYVHVSCA